MSLKKNFIFLIAIVFLTACNISNTNQSKQIDFIEKDIKFEGISSFKKNDYHPFINNSKVWLLVESPHDLRERIVDRLSIILSKAGYSCIENSKTKEIFKDLHLQPKFFLIDSLNFHEFKEKALEKKYWNSYDLIVCGRINCFHDESLPEDFPAIYKSSDSYIKAIRIKEDNIKDVWKVIVGNATSKETIERYVFTDLLIEKFGVELSKLFTKISTSKNKPLVENLAIKVVKKINKLNAKYEYINLLIWKPYTIIESKRVEPKIGNWFYNELLSVLFKNKLRNFKIVDREHLDKTMNEIKQQHEGLFDDDTIVDVGNKIGANLGITIEMIYKQTKINVYSKIIDIKTSEIMGTEKIELLNEKTY